MKRNVVYFMVFATLIIGLAIIVRPPQNGRPVVGVILATTGGSDFIGKPERSVLEMLAEDYSTRGQFPFDLVVKDSQGKVDAATQLFDSFTADPNVIAIIGPSTSGESIPLARLAKESKVPLLSLAASKLTVEDPDSSGQTNAWAFKFAQNDDLAAKRLVRRIHQDGHSKVALLFSEDGFGKSGASVFAEEVDDTTLLTVAYQKAFVSSLTTPEPEVAAIPPNIDAVVIWGTAPGPSLLVKGIRELKSELPIYLSHGNASEDFIASTGIAAEGCVVVGSRVLVNDSLLTDSPRDTVIRSYRKMWASREPGAPSHFGGHARDAFEALVRVFEANPTPNREDVRNELEQLHTMHGVTGTFSFSEHDHAGLSEEAFEVYVITGGMFLLAPSN